MNQIIEKENVENLIYEIRGKQVMIDSDLAKLYNTETKRINEAVRNNPDKFPERFSWILTDKEEVNLRSKFSTSSDISNHGGRRYNIRVFTEQGVAMLSTVLKSKVATEVSIAIMDAFVAMKRYISNNLIEQNYINKMVIDHEERLKIVESTFSSFEEKNNHLFFEGQIYDAYSLLIDIFNKSKKEIVIIDNKFHNRFIIIDRKILYHCGASFKDLGKKCFAITKLEDEEYLNKTLKTININ